VHLNHNNGIPLFSGHNG